LVLKSSMSVMSMNFGKHIVFSEYKETKTEFDNKSGRLVGVGVLSPIPADSRSCLVRISSNKNNDIHRGILICHGHVKNDFVGEYKDMQSTLLITKDNDKYHLAWSVDGKDTFYGFGKIVDGNLAFAYGEMDSKFTFGIEINN